MKKIFTSLFAMAAVFCASATPTYTVNPESESTIDNRDNFTVTFTFDEEVTVKSVEFIGGARFNATVTPGTLDVTASKTVEVAVPNTVWGTPDAGQYLLEVNLPEIFDKDGNQIMVDAIDDEGNAYSYAYTASAYYSSPDTTPVKFEGVDPDPAYTTAWDAYYDGWGAVNFMFSGEISFSDDVAGALVTYNLTKGLPISVEYSSDELWCDWNMWNGFYCVEVLLPADASLTSENLASIEVELVGVMSGMNPIEVDAVKYNAALATKSIKKAKTASALTISEANSSFDVYDLHGVRVMSNATLQTINNLPKGLLIVDGKKVCIR